MLQHLRFAALLGSALALGACGGTDNRGVESVHQPVVKRTDYVFDVAAGRQGLAPGEAERLDGWLSSLRAGYGDRVAIDGTVGPDARDAIAAQASRYGLLVSPNAPITASAVPPGTVRVVVSRSEAQVPGCPDYSRASQPNFTAQTSSNFGCAVNSNIAAMVAQPEDLVRGQPGTLTDPATSTRAIERYREAPAATTTVGGASAGSGGQ